MKKNVEEQFKDQLWEVLPPHKEAGTIVKIVKFKGNMRKQKIIVESDNKRFTVPNPNYLKIHSIK